MALTETQLAFVRMLRTSLRLQDPQVEQDPVYVYTDAELWEVLELVTPIYNSEYTADTVPQQQKYLVLILAKKEIFYRLATSTAPLYELSAEGATLKRNIRFDHYMALIKVASSDYESALETFLVSGIVETYDTLRHSRAFSLKEFNLTNAPVVTLTIEKIDVNSVEISWTPFSHRKETFFCYKIYVTTDLVVDEYSEVPVDARAVPKYVSYDIHRNKIRITGLNAETDYYITILSIDRNGLYGFSAQTITTLAS